MSTRLCFSVNCIPQDERVENIAILSAVMGPGGTSACPGVAERPEDDGAEEALGHPMFCLMVSGSH